MLKSLSVQNFALIEHVSLDFHKGLHVITGETGSGKSILLGALNLILGERSDFSVIRDPGKKTVVEAVFEPGSNFKEWFAEEDIDWDTETVIRREITSQGKSRSFINDTPVQLSQLKELTEQLVYIHSQHETLEIKKTKFQFDLLDAYGDGLELASRVSHLYQQVQRLYASKEQAEQAKSSQLQELDYVRFQLNELEQLDLDKVNYESLEQDFSKLSRIDDLKEAYASVTVAIDQESGAADILRRLKSHIDKWKNADLDLEAISSRLNEVIVELGDISRDSDRQLNQLEGDPEAFFRLTQLLDEYNKILRKHHASTQEELIGYRNSLNEKMNGFTFSDERIAGLTLEIETKEKELEQLSFELYEKRSAVIPELEIYLLDLLSEMKMEHSRFQIVLNKLDRLDTNGGMTIQILFSANRGLDLKPIERAASGGELSRVMLAIQLVMSGKKSLPTLILDEIDTGVSGEVALRMGKLLKEMGKHLQVFAITHLPQVAAKGDFHFEVSKSHENGQTISRIEQLNKEQRIEALAKLISGEQVTDLARFSAIELMN
ncbi:DNA repair protein RecN [Fluviicola sp.]|jgi:DNA repair protein RecN (Recombination protein N)|uniref:DNA repair protein RecN n=1 Tax=Fluviicola sp. TaxID=1917219 RepID=UPI00282DDD11|nr:DNA repair protein RecN [Fluviicola sp.]MDR0801244.1 DNA repair protein RecN [Fluviicola sp.]